MIRWVFWLLGGVLLGGLVHVASILLLPRAATQDAYARLLSLAPVNSVMPLDGPTPEAAVMPWMDAAFAVSVCRYDLGEGPIKLAVPVSQAYTSVSFYSRTGVAYYAINDRAASRRMIELDLMTSKQRSAIPDDEEVTAADRLIVESPTVTGVILMRALSPSPSAMEAARSSLSGARCAVQS